MTEESQSYYHSSSNQNINLFSLQGQGLSSSMIETKHNNNPLVSRRRQIEIHNKLLFPTIATNKENSQAPQPKVKIVDLQHNLLLLDGNQNASSDGAYQQSLRN